jgi:hypothetical protein
VIVGLLPEMLSSLENLRLLCFGVLLLVVLWVAPTGTGVVTAALRRLLPARPAAADAVGGATLPCAMPQRGAASAVGLSMVFGGVRAVDDLSFDLPPGQVTSLIGPMARASRRCSTCCPATTARARARRLGAQALPARGACHSARHGISRTYQTTQLFAGMSAVDNVAIALTRGKLGAARHRRIHAVGAREARALLAACGYTGNPMPAPPIWPTWIAAWWRSRAGWRRARRCCCWTSRRPGCRAKTRRHWAGCCAGSPTAVWRWAWSNTTCRW